MKRYAFTIYNLSVSIVLFAGSFANLEYDDGAIGFIYFLVVYPIFGFVFHFTNELLFMLNGNVSFPFQWLATFTIGMLFSGAIDFLRFQYANRSTFKKSI
jgi:hypothetical protein